MPHPLLSDAWVRAEIDAAVRPFEGALPPSRIEWMREQLAETLATNPEAAKLLRRAHPMPVESSGEVAAEPELETSLEKPGRTA